MYRPRGNLSFTRKPSVDPAIGNELAKLARAIPNLSYGDQFPGRQSTFGDMHFYTGEDTTDYKKNNWYIRPVSADETWHSMNAVSVAAEGIQAGVIGSGVKVTDSLQLLGGEMLGKIIFSADQRFKPELLESGIIPPGVSMAGYVPATGGTYIGNLDLTDHTISSIKALYGFDNLIYIDMNVDGHLSLGADIHMILTAPNIDLIGALGLTGALIASGSITGTSFVKVGGTSAQFLKADGSVDSSTYLTAETDPVFSAWLIATPPLYSETDPIFTAWAPYTHWPVADAVGVLANDGAGNLSWSAGANDVDGGFANSVYLPSQNYDGGGA